MFYRTGLHKCFAKFTGKHLCSSNFLLKLQAFRPETSLKEDSNTVVFLRILQNFKKTFFTEHLRTTAHRKYQPSSFPPNYQTLNFSFPAILKIIILRFTTLFYQYIFTEAAVRRCSTKKVFLKNS